MKQHAQNLLMIQPVRFTFNEQTADSNSFQQAQAAKSETQELALVEFTNFVSVLRANGVSVLVVNDTPEPHTPDSIFPNNWLGMLHDGTVVLFPMQAPNRRAERRQDIIDTLSTAFTVNKVVDYSPYELQSKYLEGTGSMVLDRQNKICYACVSPRTDIDLVNRFCNDFQYKPILFNATDRNGNPIYHTNVVMCVGSQFMVVCLECVSNETDRKRIVNATKKAIVEISQAQLEHFAGNMLEVVNDKGETLLVMSQQAYNSLRATQVAQLSMFAKIVTAPLDTIESNGGGSARCMMAEIFLPTRV
ncbi:MAG: arginine deiminase-related protein [Bacteroidia bacterium]|jgi:hypothetical protein|nr:arginine deiminase-related protein [Bacteroidia bacterium]